MTLLLYGMMVGMSVSASRAIGMYLLQMVGDIRGKDLRYTDRCGAVGGIAGVAATGAAWGCELFDVFWGGAGDLLVDTGVCRGW